MQVNDNHTDINKFLDQAALPAEIVDLVRSEIKFVPGEIMATPGARLAFEASGDNPTLYLLRHLCGDWGLLGMRECYENEHSLVHGGRIISRYRLCDGAVVWCITDENRSATTFVQGS